MRSRLFHAVVAGGIALGASSVACLSADTSAPGDGTEVTDPGAAVPAVEHEGGSPSLSRSDAGPDAIAPVVDAGPDQASEDHDGGWPPTK
jgi:hypothetical protein